MARTRSIHPGAPTDEDVAEMTIHARYVWAYLPCHADKEGRLEDKPFSLRLDILPLDNVDMNALLQELADKRHIIRYRGDDGRRYIQIRNFERWQRPHAHEKASRIPPPPGSFAHTVAQIHDIPVASTDNAGTSTDDARRRRSCPDPSPVPVPEIPPPARDPGPPEPVRPERPVLGRQASPEGRTLPVDGPSLIVALRVACERERPQDGFWDKGSFAEKEADEVFEDLPADERIKRAPRLLALVDEFAKAQGGSVKAFRRWLDDRRKASAPRASPGQPQPPKRLPSRNDVRETR